MQREGKAAKTERRQKQRQKRTQIPPLRCGMTTKEATAKAKTRTRTTATTTARQRQQQQQQQRQQKQQQQHF
jgi:hypothetical protein